MNSDADISSICMNLLAYVSLSSSGHWTFFIIAIKVRRVYILDSPFKEGNKNPSHYRLISVIESALLSIKPTFDMVNLRHGNTATYFFNLCSTLSMCIKSNFPKCGTTRKRLQMKI